MHIEGFRNYCLEKPFVTEHFPFDERTLVFKVDGKMFALADIEAFNGINLKCDPQRSIELRERYYGIEPGYHMNKVHWNTVKIGSDVDDALIFALIDHSFDLVFASLSKKRQHELQNR
jgi:predicted DNA-binding protein (MmcQ/YjbR family)